MDCGTPPCRYTTDVLTIPRTRYTDTCGACALPLLGSCYHVLFTDWFRILLPACPAAPCPSPAVGLIGNFLEGPEERKREPSFCRTLAYNLQQMIPPSPHTPLHFALQFVTLPPPT